MELATDDVAAANFIKGIIPGDIDIRKVELPENIKNILPASSEENK